MSKMRLAASTAGGPADLGFFIPGNGRLQCPCSPRPGIAARGNGGASRDRTDDLKLAKLALSQLSYGPVTDCNRGSFYFVHFAGRRGAAVVGREGVEPSTSRLSGVRSNHLSYRPPCPAGQVAAGGVSQLRLHFPSVGIEPRLAQRRSPGGEAFPG